MTVKYRWLQIHYDKYTNDADEYWYYESPRKKFHLIGVELGPSEDAAEVFIAQERRGIKSICGRKLKHTEDLMLARSRSNLPAYGACKRCQKLMENQSKDLYVSMSVVKM